MKDRGALVRLERRPDLEHHPSEPRHKSAGARAFGHFVQERLGGPRVLSRPVVEGEAQPLVLDRPVDGVRERTQAAAPLRSLRVELEAVPAHVDELVDSHDALRFLACAAAHAGDERVLGGEAAQLGARLVRHARVLRTVDDRSEDAVHVEEDPGPPRLGAQRLEQFVGLHPPTIRAVRLIPIGLLAGFLGALFGVGGGIIVVPLLILTLAYAPHMATATSMAAIGITALAGAITFAIAGEVDFAYAALVGLPAAFGAALGATLQQRVRARELSLLFAAFLVAIAVWLLV